MPLTCLVSALSVKLLEKYRHSIFKFDDEFEKMRNKKDKKHQEIPGNIR